MLPKSTIKVVSPRNKILKDLKKMIGASQQQTTFGKKWSMASTTDSEENADNKIKQFMVAINNTLDDFKYPDQIVWHKNKYNTNVPNIWKSSVLNRQPYEIFMIALSRIIALMKTCEKFIKYRSKSKKSKGTLSSNTTLAENYESRND